MTLEPSEDVKPDVKPDVKAFLKPNKSGGSSKVIWGNSLIMLLFLPMLLKI